MTAVGIVGAGRGATLHAEAVRAVRGVRLAGVATASSTPPGSGRAQALAEALDCEVLTLAELGRASDAAVVATPPAARVAALAELALSPRLRAVLVESPAATTLGGVAALGAPRPGLAVMLGANLLHAPAVRRMLDATAAMVPHHLELRLAVPDPARGPSGASAFGGGVTMDPAAGFWPMLMAAAGAPVTRVTVPRVEMAHGVERYAEVILRTDGGHPAAAVAEGQAGHRRVARAVLSWGARVAEASLEAADSDHVARVDLWPVPTVEIDGAAAGPPAEPADALAALGFAAQMQRLARVANGEAQPWPDMDVAAAALTVAAAAALSAKRDGVEVSVSEVPHHLSPHQILNPPRPSRVSSHV